MSSYKGSGPGIWGCGSSGNSSGLAQATILLALSLKMPVRTPPRPGWVRAGKRARASQGQRVVSLGDGRAASRRGAPCTRLCGPQREGTSEGDPASKDTHDTHVPVQCCTRATQQPSEVGRGIPLSDGETEAHGPLEPFGLHTKRSQTQGPPAPPASLTPRSALLLSANVK